MKYLKILALAAMVFMTGCANWTTASVYSTTTTPTGTQTNAQGDAAKYAAMVNQTYNCATCTDVQKEAMIRNLSRMYIAETDQNWATKTRNDMGETVTWRLNRALDQALFLLLQDY
jgi:hypothetical protein